MKIIITAHARDRVIERIGCREHKVEKVVHKAYRSKEKIRKLFLVKRKFNGYDNTIYRMFQGCVFCFEKCKDEKYVLITVLINDK
jgi:ribosomal protein L27